MGNTYADRTWTIDTAGEIHALGVKVKISGLEWHPNAVDNDLSILDGNSKRIWHIRAKVAAGANSEEPGVLTKAWPEGQWFDGFNVSVIDGGTLYVFLA